MIPALRIAAASALAAAIPLGGFIRNERAPGVPFVVAAPHAIEYRVHAGTAAGMRNTAGAAIITPGSTPTAAVLAAFATWSRIEGSAIRFLAPAPASDGNSRPDGVSLITFEDTPGNRALAFGAIAVTRLLSDASGVLEDTDIVFNPEMVFSTTLEQGTFDIQGALTHELGHALGLDHSGSVSAAMFATTTRGSKRLRTLSADDEAFARDAYPAESQRRTGVIEGVARLAEGGAIPGAIVTALDPARNVAVSAISGSDGRFRIPDLPEAEYALTVEPLDGPATPLQLAFWRRDANTSFRTRIPGGAAAPSLTTVAADGVAVVELSVEAGPPAYNLIGLSAARPGQDFGTRAGAVLERGAVYEARLDGQGLEDAEISLDSLRVLGMGVEILQSPLERGRTQLADGTDYPNLLFEIRVAADAPLGAASLALTTPLGEAVFSTGFEIVEPVPRPLFLPDAVVNAASFTGGAAAPGSLVSIFGEELAGGEAAGYVDPVTGRVGDLLAGVSVRFGGRPAAMLFVSPGQLNVQAPADLPAGATALAIDRDGVSSPSVAIEVAGAAPGLFEGPAGGALAVQTDGALNSPATPVRRGDFVSLYGVGGGAVSPPLVTGELAPAAPLSRIEAPVEIEIGGLRVEPEFAGMAPGFAGLLQINVRVPGDAPTGPAVPLLVRAGGAAAQQRWLSIE